MRVVLRIIVVLVLLGYMFDADAQEEFSGPFPSWANVKTRFRAAGDGVKDDTRAIQQALDSLSVFSKNFNAGQRAYMVVYLPKGRYKISQTLVLSGKIGVSFIGEDPENTTIEWAGGANDTMLLANGAAYFKLSRIGWNAKNKEKITAVGIHWKSRWNTEKSQSFAPLNIEVSDCRFVGKCSYGIHGGTFTSTGTGANDSEIAIRRCYFDECGEAAIAIEGYNALDYWIWDCRFYNCYRCVRSTNGNYHLYGCYFQDTKNAVLVNSDAIYTSVRNCYSVNMAGFSYDYGRGCNAFKRVFENNFIGKTKEISIEYHHLGRIYYSGNTFEGNEGEKGNYSLIYESWCPGKYEVLSVANKYSMARPWKLDIAEKDKTIYTINDKTSVSVAANKSLTAASASFLKVMPQTPRAGGRRIFEVPVNSGSAAIQRIIVEAAKYSGQRPIVHFGVGTYILDKPLVIPANTDMQLIGDGLLYASTINITNTFPTGQPFILVKGPSYVTIKDLYLDQNVGNKGSYKGIVFEGIDQANSKAFVDQLNSSANHALVLDKTDYLYVQHMNSFFSDGSKVVGGELVKRGTGTSALYCFGAQFAGVQVTNNGRFVAKDCWWEGASRQPISLTGSGNVTIDGAMVAGPADSSTTAIMVNDFTGKVTLMNMYVQGGLNVKPANKGLDLLLWNINYYHKMNPNDFATKQSAFRAALLGITAQCMDDKRPGCGNPVSFDKKLVNVPDENSFILSNLGDARKAIPILYTPSVKGTSNIFVSRVSIGSVDQAITFGQ